ncbi:MAG: nucleoside monophosphate kinase [Elusimicrobia bacterium]|nr:nucleoside monophosphate kinase [Elusimicrobiota bacterium]
MPRAIPVLASFLLAASAAAQVQVAVPVRLAPVAAPAPVPAPAAAIPKLSSLPILSALPVASVAAVPLVPRAIVAPTVGARAQPLAGALRPSRRLRLVITGPPGSGKGTYSARIEQEYGPVAISAGALLREYARDKPELQAIMNRGELVPSELIVALMRARLAQDDVRDRGFILDGFPRRAEEARALEAILDELGTPLDAVVFLEVPESELLRRILARGRADDNETTFRERMRVYRDETLPVLELLRARAPFLTPSVAAGNAERAYVEVRRAIEGLSR